MVFGHNSGEWKESNTGMRFLRQHEEKAHGSLRILNIFYQLDRR